MIGLSLAVAAQQARVGKRHVRPVGSHVFHISCTTRQDIAPQPAHFVHLLSASLRRSCRFGALVRARIIASLLLLLLRPTRHKRGNAAEEPSELRQMRFVNLDIKSRVHLKGAIVCKWDWPSIPFKRIIPRALSWLPAAHHLQAPLLAASQVRQQAVKCPACGPFLLVKIIRPLKSYEIASSFFLRCSEPLSATRPKPSRHESNASAVSPKSIKESPPMGSSEAIKLRGHTRAACKLK